MNWLCANYWTYNSDKRRELCGLSTITYSAEPQNWWQGQYKESIRYYIRALAMNPKADNAWQYLRISLRYMCFTLQLVEKFAVHQNSFHLYVLISQFGTLCIACLPCSFNQILCLKLSVNCFAVVHHDLIWLMLATSKTWNYFRRSTLSDSSPCMHVPQHLLAHKFVGGWAAYTSYHIRMYRPQ
jgi:tetratricopeptide (TPR) repeat protein